MIDNDKITGQEYESAMIGDPKPKRQMTIASFCAMTCAEGGFHKFLQEVEGVNVTDATSAKDYVCAKVGIESRTELNAKGPEQEAWLRLQAQYQDWLRS